MAEKYLLQVTAGPSYDPAILTEVKVNSEEPLEIKGSSLHAHLYVRIKNFRGLPKDSPTTSPYFSHSMHKSDQYSISFGFIPQKSISGDALIFGNNFDNPIRDRLPPFFGAAFKMVKYFIDPGMDGDPYADKPYLYGPALSSLNIFRVCEKIDVLPQASSKDAGVQVFEEGGDGDGLKAREEKNMPATATQRKKYYLDEENRKNFSFEAGRLYQCDFFNPFLDFNEFALKLPGFSFSIVNHHAGEPDSDHTLRYVLKNKHTDETYLVIVLTMLRKEDINASSKAAAQGPQAPLVSTGTLNQADDTVSQEKLYEPKSDDLD
ncbi:MAG: hypothetical protein M1829_000503 [Trizodia sp. TS-e1964]|nr:MAG: hypothetical protein M1829_000503 [Trizodia sp. TS-e1964]